MVICIKMRHHIGANSKHFQYSDFYTTIYMLLYILFKFMIVVSFTCSIKVSIIAA